MTVKVEVAPVSKRGRICFYFSKNTPGVSEARGQAPDNASHKRKRLRAARAGPLQIKQWSTRRHRSGEGYQNSSTSTTPSTLFNADFI